MSGKEKSFKDMCVGSNLTHNGVRVIKAMLIECDMKRCNYDLTGNAVMLGARSHLIDRFIYHMTTSIADVIKVCPTEDVMSRLVQNMFICYQTARVEAVSAGQSCTMTMLQDRAVQEYQKLIGCKTDSKKYENDPLGKRMKGYERSYTDTILPKDQFVVVRIDGKAFHSYTKGMTKPFDRTLMKTMDATTLYLVEQIQGCILGYTQSDEISLIIAGDLNERSQLPFGGKVQKLASICASMATACFNRTINTDKLAFFDARVFSIPKDDIGNYLVWRLRDCIKNSIQSYAQSMFSHKDLVDQGKADQLDMIRAKVRETKQPVWEQLAPRMKFGQCVMLNRVAEPCEIVDDDLHYVPLNDEFDYYDWSNLINEYYDRSKTKENKDGSE